MVRDGVQVFEFPFHSSQHATIQSFGRTVIPSRAIIDNRSTNRKNDDLLGKAPQTTKEDLNSFRSFPFIVDCIPRNYATDASLTQHPILGAIILIMRHPDNRWKTLLKIYSNKKPFEKKQEVVIDFESYYAIVSLERRSSEEQDSNKFIVIALIKDDLRNHKLVKVSFQGTTCNPADIIMSEMIDDELLICHTMSDNLFVAFYPYCALMYD